MTCKRLSLSCGVFPGGVTASIPAHAHSTLTVRAGPSLSSHQSSWWNRWTAEFDIYFLFPVSFSDFSVSPSQPSLSLLEICVHIDRFLFIYLFSFSFLLSFRLSFCNLFEIGHYSLPSLCVFCCLRKLAPCLTCDRIMVTFAFTHNLCGGLVQRSYPKFLMKVECHF